MMHLLLLYIQYSYFTALLDITVVSSYRNQQLFVGLSQYLRHCFNSQPSLNKFVLLYFTRHSFHFVNVFNTCQPPWSVSRIIYIDKERVRAYFSLKSLIFSLFTFYLHTMHRQLQKVQLTVRFRILNTFLGENISITFLYISLLASTLFQPYKCSMKNSILKKVILH